MAQKKGVILVTGCSGRIGTRVVERFGSDYYMVGFDSIAPLKKSPQLDFIYVDLSSDHSVQQGFAQIKQRYGNKILSVIHLAAYYSFSGGAWELYEKITVKGTGRLLHNLKEFEVEQFLFSSTQLVYAPCEVGQKIREESPVLAKWAYPLSKVKTEALIHKERGNIPSVILRIAGCYDDECHSIPLSNQIQRIYEKQLTSHFFPGDLSHGAPFLHFEDLVEALWLIVEKRKELPTETLLLLGEEQTLSYDELQRSLGRLLHGKEFKTYKIPKWFAKLGAWVQEHLPFVEKPFIKPWMIDLADDHYELDVSKAKQLIGWQPKHSLRESLPKMTLALKKNPTEWYRVHGLKK